MLGYVFYSGQIEMALAVLYFYFLGKLFIRFILKCKEKIVVHLYHSFFLIYGLLVLLTQIELIHDPMTDFYIHNDAAWSFYNAIMNYVVPESWDNLVKVTMQNSIFVDYPIASYIFGFLGKLGVDTGILDIRLYLRIHIFTLAALIIAIISHIFVIYKISSKDIVKWVLLFGFCSYLYVTSAIFTRDIHVCFVYTLFGYYILVPNLKCKFFIFLLLILFATGLRPANGIVLIIPLLFYYWSYNSKNKRTINVLLFLLILIIIMGVLKTDIISYGVERLDLYKEKTLSNSGGVFEKVFSLPFPINQIGMIVYMSLMPLPILVYIVNEGGTFLTLPFIFSPYLMSIVLIGSIWYMLYNYKINKRITVYLASFLLLYFIIIYGSPDLRRAFAAIPSLFMGFCLIKNNIPLNIKKFTYRVVWPIILLLNIFFIFYLYL